MLIYKRYSTFLIAIGPNYMQHKTWFDYSKYYAEDIGISILVSRFIYYLQELKETMWKMEN